MSDPAHDVIDQENMFAPLLEADPSFAPIWEEFLTDWRDEPPPLPLYLALGDLARHLTAKLQAGDTEAFSGVFRVVERWHVEGDTYVRQAATIGVLEGLQNTNNHETTKPEQFISWLGPVSRRYWGKVDAFWNQGILIRDDDVIVRTTAKKKKRWLWFG